MFGIGLPEMILILALALIVVGPDKLPELARSLAKGVMELKKTAEGFKESMEKEGNPLAETKKDLEEAAQSLKKNLLDTPNFKNDIESHLKDTTGAGAASNAYQELMKNNINTQVDTSDFIEIAPDPEPTQPIVTQDEAPTVTPISSETDANKQDQ